MNSNTLSVFLADVIRTTLQHGQSFLDALSGIQAVVDAIGDLPNAQIKVWSYCGGGWIASTVETAGVARPNFCVHVVRFPGAKLVPSIRSELGWVYDVAGLKNIPHGVVEQDCRGDVKEGKAARVILWPKVCSCLALAFYRPQADRLCAQGSEGPLVFVVTAGSNDTVCLVEGTSSPCSTGKPFSLAITKCIVKQALLALDFVHTKAKIVHCDAVFPCEDIAPDAVYTNPYETRAPEQFLGCTGSTGIDIWAIGCLVYECLTLKTLFGTKTADDQLGLVEHHIGLFPREFLARSPIQHKYFDPSGAQFINLHLRVRQS
ncbi:hypothetical protein TRAPUB_5423 [Trametes pubescens]|uniref:Protein kinase domain-containing protein n=1 Tax=Trametes pubescens TaxID=154538 RepID=A0A1M2V8G0_TRAPU|nr:hypothetical protein TRAPUB_5423 [Trametes pubescens]